MLDALEFPKTGFPEDFFFVVSEVTDNGVDLVILLDMLKSTFPIHWLFSLDLLDLYSKVFTEEYCLLSFFCCGRKIVMDSEFMMNPKNSITLLDSLQGFFLLQTAGFEV